MLKSKNLSSTSDLKLIEGEDHFEECTSVPANLVTTFTANIGFKNQFLKPKKELDFEK